jgi:hypothetical protein
MESFEFCPLDTSVENLNFDEMFNLKSIKDKKNLDKLCQYL